MSLFSFLVLNLFLLLLQLTSICLAYNLFFKFQSMLFQQLFSFMFKFFLKFSDLFLLTNCRFKLGLFCSCLFLKHSFFLHLLFDSCLFKLGCFLWSYFSLLSLFFSGSSFICLNCSFSSQGIEFSLSIGSFLL